MFTCLLLLFVNGCPTDWLAEQRLKLPVAHQRIEQAMCDLSFGEKQVEQFICDRPGTGKVINREPVFRMTLVWYFAGQLKGDRVYWDCREPHSGREAEHSLAISGYPVLVRVSNRLSPIDGCASLLFELLNYDVDNEYHSAFNASSKNRQSREEFAMNCVRLEFEAMKRLQSFFWEHPLEGPIINKDPWYFYIVFMPRDFDTYFKSLDPAYLDYYRQGYDRMFPKRPK